MENVTIFYQFFKGRKKKREEDNKAPQKDGKAKTQTRSLACFEGLRSTEKPRTNHAVQQKAHRAWPACLPACSGTQSFETSQASGGLAFSWELMINQLCEGGIDAAWGRGAQKSIARNLFPLLSLSPLPSRHPTHPKPGLQVHSFTGFPSFQASGPNRWAHLCFHENVPKQWNNQQQSV